MIPAFPCRMPTRKPSDRPLSAAMARMYDVWNPYEDRGNEFFSNFLYTPLSGFEERADTSRRDPSKVLRVNGVYHVYYTYRRTVAPPAGPDKATDEIPSVDWDLADIWHATSRDGFLWEERGPVLRRPPKGQLGCRSNATPDILVWKGRYYLYVQTYREIIGPDDACPVAVAVANSPDGPFELLDHTVVEPGGAEDWDCACIHDPYPLVYRGQVWLYYKGCPGTKRGGENIIRAQGVAIADDPAGPFVKSPLNPVTNSGHETCLWPYREGIAALLSLDGPEKNSIQYAPDGLNFEPKSCVVLPPVAPGPFVPDAFAGNGDGRGFTWGLCHVNPAAGSGMKGMILARFDCCLSRDIAPDEAFKRNNIRFDTRAYFQRAVALPEELRKRRSQLAPDRDTIGA